MTSAHAQCAFLGTFPFESMEAEIAKLLNFNGNDTEHLTDLFNEYLSNPWEENSETDKTNDDGSSLDGDDEFNPRLSGFDSVMQNKEVIAEYASCTAETIDEVEWEKAIKFSCTCQYNHGDPCYRLFVPEEMIRRRMTMRELTPRQRIMGSSSFYEFWKKLCPFIITARPMTDLCWTCQRNNTLIFRSANLTDANKSERVRLQEQHLFVVQKERSLYRTMLENAKQTCKRHAITDLSTSAPCSRNLTMHYSFDYAQQVHLPSNPLQPGPIYFLVPRKYGLFGVCCEGLPRQVNVLIDEAHLISKGSNAVVSFLHYFFNNYGIGETDVHLHCDNCSGQNKNRFVIWYCAWRVAMGLHKSITLNFLITGHTKFSPDWCFGLLKKAFRRHVVPALSVLEEVVNGSADVNVAQVVGREDGTTVVPVYDWQAFSQDSCKPVPGLKKFQHFRFDANHPGIVFAKYDTEGEEVAFPVLLPKTTFPTGEATVIQPPGLSLQRQAYLFKFIREFVEQRFQDIVCPRPEEIMPSEEISVTNRGRGSAGGRGNGGAAGRGRGGAARRGHGGAAGRGRVGAAGRGRGGGCSDGQRNRSRCPH